MQRSLSLRALILAVVAAVALATGCGSSKHATTSTTASNPTAPLTTISTATATSPTTSGPKTTTTATSSTTTTHGTTTTGASHPTGGAGVSGGQSSAGSGGSTNARVPATFTIASGGRISPMVVSAPAFLAVQLTVVSHDGKAHQVLLRTPTPHSLTVSAHGHASVLIPGLRAGHYLLEIDGASLGSLTIGGEPGP